MVRVGVWSAVIEILRKTTVGDMGAKTEAEAVVGDWEGSRTEREACWNASAVVVVAGGNVG